MSFVDQSQENATKTSTLSMRLHRKEKAFAWLMLVLILAGAGFVALSLSNLQTHYSVSQFLPEKHPLLIADLEARKQFFLDESQPALVTLRLKEGQGDWFKMDHLKTLERMTSELGSVEGVKSALSLATIQGASQSSDELNVGSILRFESEEERRSKVLGDPMLSPLVVSRDGRTTLVLVSLIEHLETDRLAKTIGSVETKLRQAFPMAQVDVGGVPAIQWRLTNLVKSELVRFMGFALLASCLTLWVVFSSLSALVLPVLAILVANVFVLGFMALAGYPMTVLAVTIPILTSVTVLTLCVHTMLRLVEEHHGGDVAAHPWLSYKAGLVVRTMKPLVMPNLLTALTTCFGFGTLMTTTVPLIREFGVAMAVSIMISWAVSSWIVVPLVLLLPIPRARGFMTREAEWVSFIFRHSRLLAISVLVFCTAFVLIGQNMKWTARLFDDLPEHESARITTERIDRELGGTIPLEVSINVPDGADPWNEPEHIAKLDQLLKEWREYPEVGSAFGLPDLLRQASGGAQSRLPASRSVVAESWFLLSMSEDSPLKSYLSGDSRATRLSVRLRDVPSNRSTELRERILAQARAAFPHAKVTAAGMASTVHTLNNELSRVLIFGFWEALGVISALLLLTFRSVRWTIMASLPNLVPTAFLVGFLAICQTPIKPGVALVFSIALGIAFNNTVYLLQRMQELMKQSGAGPREEVVRMLRLEANACLVSSIAVLAGFGIFLFSEFGINRTFGAYMLVSLGVGLIGDLVLMPALIHWIPSVLVSKEAPAIQYVELPETSELEPAPSAVIDVPTQPLDLGAGHRPTKEDLMKSLRENKELIQRAAACLAVFITTFASPMVSAAPDAEKILKEIQTKISSRDEAAHLKMKVVESNGTAKEREIVIKRKSGGKQQVLVRLMAPSDVSGIALLSVTQGKSEDQWLYMPSQKKARRVVSGSKSQRFLDSEFNLEDFSANTYAKFDNKVIKEMRSPAAALVVIESKAKSDDTSYSKILTWVDQNNYQVQKSEYYDRDGKLLKTMVFRDYKKYGKTWRAGTIEVLNVQTKRSTVLKIAGLKLNTGLSDSEFTQSALEEDE